MFHMASPTFLFNKSTDLRKARTWVFEFILVCAETLKSPSSVHIQILSDFIRCKFFCYFSLSSSFSAALVVKCLSRFCNFLLSRLLSFLSESGLTLLGRENRAQFKCFVHVHTTIHLVESEHVQWSVRFVPIFEIRSAEHMFKILYGFFQSVNCPLYRLAFVCLRVVIVTKNYVSFFLICSSWLWACAVFFCCLFRG